MRVQIKQAPIAVYSTKQKHLLQICVNNMTQFVTLTILVLLSTCYRNDMRNGNATFICAVKRQIIAHDTWSRLNV